MGRAGFEPATSGSQDILIDLKDIDFNDLRRYLNENLSKTTARDLFFRIKKILRYSNYLYSVEKVLEFLKHYKGQSLNNYKKAIKWLDKYLKERGYNVNVYEQIKSFGGWQQYYNTIFEKISDLSEEIVKEAINYIKDEECKIFYAFLTVSGIRKSEALSISVDWIDLDKRFVKFPPEMQRRTKKVYICFFTSEVKDMLEDWINKIGNRKRLFAIGDTRYKNMVKQILKGVGVRITAQELRKFFATYSIEKGMNPILVDYLQGRLGSSVLAKHYLKPHPIILRKQYDKVWEKFRFSCEK